MKYECLNIIKKLNRVEFFTEEDIEFLQYSDRAEEGMMVVKANIDKFDIEEFILRAYLADEDLNVYKGLSVDEIYKILYNEIIYESDNCRELKAIHKDDIENLFIKKVLKKIDINKNEIKNLFWIEEDRLDQIILFNTEQHNYYIHRFIG